MQYLLLIVWIKPAVAIGQSRWSSGSVWRLSSNQEVMDSIPTACNIFSQQLKRALTFGLYFCCDKAKLFNIIKSPQPKIINW